MPDATAGGTAGRLTTHVLDTARGKPAAGVAIALYGLLGETRRLLTEATTNADGRCDAPLLGGDAFGPGLYELVFSTGRYFDAEGHRLPEPKFLDDVVIRFGMAEARHYHVPLLISPFGYSTYRGS